MFRRKNKREEGGEGLSDSGGAAHRAEEFGAAAPKLDDFEVYDTLGTGTFGRVRLCRHTASSKYYALKLLKKYQVVRLKQVEHVLNERRILIGCNHPFVVRLSASFQDPSNLYMVMELVIGGELFSHLRKAGRFSNETTRVYAAQIILALQYLHERDVVYRDLKPENVLLDERGYIRICDFGFAKEVVDRTWTLCGTPEYLAPEVIQSKGHGKAVDWWALGILMYEMLAGYPPFYDENPFGIYQKILLGRTEYPRHFDQHAKDLIRRLLQTDRSKRYGNLKGGADDVRKHKWFKGLDFDLLLKRQSPPPIVPEVRHPADTRNFESYPDSVDDGHPPPLIDDTANELFEDF
mmetsp:Transcript_52570/g.128467  ORF Transcript_52570/g.128467 Transcript_52570/m.128467 type:complete len:350 (-) Transcript_52570:50-1099(-)|eukprot:CAMPEP_0206230414 /NCGR_PEP_ID=MMETSP0047_2-20121206/10249_1 /ASSEMBLY_ACC=CAM_ASM_000192 /TAXON_ID=195065 /ORGANISM="Chroomonas mesostigmatica_cf, Strain CCMP1168" /LENGTH=349 /DNA_ID=CAMNT_0053653841 /DNA_START=128 /DNA_END=1177 /DNA_ORIENTATION=-